MWCSNLGRDLLEQRDARIVELKQQLKRPLTSAERIAQVEAAEAGADDGAELDPSVALAKARAEVQHLQKSLAAERAAGSASGAVTSSSSLILLATSLVVKCFPEFFVK